ncbi:MAG: DUF3616 domain-containing protein [Verrucomicrobia bacterium]|nr:DUF3616 domain-containing protein [Verrucomicrobiota bacterium]
MRDASGPDFDSPRHDADDPRMRCGRTPGGLWALVALMMLAPGSPPVFAKEVPGLVEGRGLANASAVVRIGPDRILAGSDDQNALVLLDARTGGAPLKILPAGPWLGLGARDGEADLEGAARIGDVVYWIGSHARNKNGKLRPERQRLLALRIAGEEGDLSLTPVGRPVATLLDSLATAPSLASLRLGAAAALPPEDPGGLNIEGLAARPDGGLWLGFRSPVPGGRALLVPLLNPGEVVTGVAPRWGDPVTLDLEGKGIRDITWTGREYFLLGGNAADGGRTRLFRWQGPGSQPEPVKAPGLKDLNAEGLAVFGTPEQPRLLVVSDDGNRSDNEQQPPAERTFRMLWVTP